MSLRGRFVAASSAIALATLSGTFSAVYLAYNATQERQLDAVLHVEAAEDAVVASRTGDPSSTDHHLHLAFGAWAPITKYATVYDWNGRAVVWTSNLDVARPRFESVRHALGAPFDLWWNNEHLRAVRVPIRGDGAPSLLLATPRTDLDVDAKDLARRMAVAVLLGVIVSAAATSRLARVLTRDHERITAVARSVAAGDLSARIGPIASDPEMAGLARDIDEMISRLTVLVETQQQFIANASHELRSPLATLLGELSFALHRDRDRVAYRQSIEEALSSARRLKLLTEDLLALARIGATELEFETVSLSEVACSAVASSRPAAAASDVTLEIACDAATVEGHAGDLQRLVRNLVENAVRHSPRGGCVRVAADHYGDDARIVVSDEGPGVLPENRERIFEPFFRLPADRADYARTGLGLAIARSIARAHGGDVWVDDSSRGARFVVRLPLSARASTPLLEERLDTRSGVRS
jgi:two-component system OmpR family sensor kinase